MPSSAIDIASLPEKRIGLLGFGLEGQATLAWLRQQGLNSTVFVFTDAPEDVPEGAVSCTDSSQLREIDLLIRSPGFAPAHRLRQAADGAGIAQTTASNLFLSALANAGLPLITLTGSKGKSTTSMLCHLMLRESSIDSVLVGNIGKPALAELPDILARRATTVMELSSYQCADLLPGNGGSSTAVLDLFPEHLDWHGSARRYFEDKLKIVASTRADGCCFVSEQANAKYSELHGLPAKAALLNQSSGLHFKGGYFRDAAALLFSDEKMRLPGLHNRFNAVAAMQLAIATGANLDACQSVIESFAGLDFRLQDEGIHNGIRWINDSLSTTPETTLAALQALPETSTLILGGFDRGYALDALCRFLDHSSLNIVLLPDTGWAIAERLKLVNHPVNCLEEAIAKAKALTPAGGLCLFSPGAPSYNQYRSFAERGEHFRQLITA
jgi:UDP-N-acetylmuramoylalanine--D-glutamate ligase